MLKRPKAKAGNLIQVRESQIHRLLIIDITKLHGTSSNSFSDMAKRWEVNPIHDKYYVLGQLES